jgi:hypothetical protein
MVIIVSAKTRQGLSGEHDRLAGWPPGAASAVTAPLAITLFPGSATQAGLIQITLDPVVTTLAAASAGSSPHYFRLADATLRPLPAAATLALARGDAYIAVSSGALRLADSPAMACYLHVHDSFNAERLAEGLLGFLAHSSSQAEFPEDVTVLVVEAR